MKKVNMASPVVNSAASQVTSTAIEFHSDNPGGVLQLWRLAYPIVISMASYTFMQFVSRMFLAWYSPDAIAAIVPAGVLTFSFICFFHGVSSFVNVLVAQYYGSKQYDNMSRTLWSGIYFSLIAGMINLALIPLGSWIINHSYHSETVKVLERQYFIITAMFGGVPILANAFSSYFIGMGRTKITMVINLGGNLLNVLLAYLLIFGKLNLTAIGIKIPELGIVGAAYAMVIANIAMLLAFIYMAFINKKIQDRFCPQKHYLFDYKNFKKLLKYGLPSGVALFLEMTSFTTFVFLIGNVDTVSLAANNIVLSIEMISFMPILGISIANSTLVGQYIGKKRTEISRKVCYSALKLSVSYCLLLGILFVSFSEFFITFFLVGISTGTGVGAAVGGVGAIMIQAKILLKILAVFIFCDAINNTFGSAIKGAGDTRFYMISYVLVAWLVFIPGVIIVLEYLHLSIEYAWLCSILYLSLLALIFFLRFRSGVWLTHKVIEHV
ncbi:MAG: MATE family efflux transporter [Oligoflexia bacterium]|nr:MATE family efflux transporter [Oligoflexia bacterium]